ncbi:MAG: hypothetical protein J6Q96_01475 [Bacteroidales bacterium]|nr:hypothetical protein [Bacteroidales bacterium]
MNDLTAFFAQNKIKQENVKYVASKSFVNANGKPLEWEIKPINTEENEALKRESMNRVTLRNGQQQLDLDPLKYGLKVAVRGTVFPDLNNKALQESYGVMGAEQLLQKMLSNAGEYQAYLNKVSEVSGFTSTMADAVEEAKN